MESIYSIKTGEVLATVLRLDEINNTRTDISNDDEIIQVCARNFQEKIKIKAHSHNQIERKISGTQEVWILLSGKIKFEIFDIDNLLISSGILFSGDSITLFRGGHSLEVLEENTIFYEIKNGPYLGINKDKKQLDE